MMKVKYSKPLKVSSCLSQTVDHKSNLMTSRNESTPITLKTLKQQEDLASSQEVRLTLLIYFTDFKLHLLVCQGFDFSESRQRGAGMLFALDLLPEHNSSPLTAVVYKLQLLAFIVSLRRAANVSPSPILIKALEFDAAITQN